MVRNWLCSERQRLPVYVVAKSGTLAAISAVTVFGLLSTGMQAQTPVLPVEPSSSQVEPVPVPTEVPVPVENPSGSPGETPLSPPLGLPVEASSQDISTVEAQLRDLDQVPLFLPRNRGRLVTTDQRLSPISPSDPSLYRIQDILTRRYNADGLIEQWQAYQLPNGLRYTDIVVDESLWRQLNYFRRYAFISQLGRDTQQDGYHLRVFHSGDAKNRRESLIPDRTTRIRRSSRTVFLRGAHFCDFTPPDAPTSRCRVFVRQ